MLAIGDSNPQSRRSGSFLVILSNKDGLALCQSRRSMCTVATGHRIDKGTPAFLKGAGRCRRLVEAVFAGAATYCATERAMSSVFEPAPNPETQAFLAQFETAWRPLDRQLRAVLRSIYAQLMGLPAPSQLSATEIRRINSDLAFDWNAGAPTLPHVEEFAIDVPSGRARIRMYDPGVANSSAAVVLLHGGGWIFGSPYAALTSIFLTGFCASTFFWQHQLEDAL